MFLNLGSKISSYEAVYTTTNIFAIAKATGNLVPFWGICTQTLGDSPFGVGGKTTPLKQPSWRYDLRVFPSLEGGKKGTAEPTQAGVMFGICTHTAHCCGGCTGSSKVMSILPTPHLLPTQRSPGRAMGCLSSKLGEIVATPLPRKCPKPPGG